MHVFSIKGGVIETVLWATYFGPVKERRNPMQKPPTIIQAPARATPPSRHTLRNGASNMVTTSNASRIAVILACFLAVTLAGCGAGGKATATSTQFIPHLDSSISHDCSWYTGHPATCKVYITSHADSNFTFNWLGMSSPAGASFTPSSGSVAPGQTSGLITVVSPTSYCPITFRFVDLVHSMEADSVFNPCTHT
jgi:hypothetical protein